MIRGEHTMPIQSLQSPYGPPITSETAKKIAAALKKSQNLEPLKVLAVLRHNVKREFFQASPIAHASQELAPREVILSSFLVQRR